MLLKIFQFLKSTISGNLSSDSYNQDYGASFRPYTIKILKPAEANRKRVSHLIANFWTGGSARLVVDLVERLGHRYEQEVVTRDIPPAPAYIGVPIVLCKEMESIQPILSELERFKPHLLHIHFLGHQRDVWGKEDWMWYHNVFNAAKKYGCKVVENINIPTDPFGCNLVNNYVYVSEYVMKEYSLPHHKNEVIYPGSDFTRFTRSDINDVPDNCIGMVYRLERDKINERSINVFIEVVKRRKGTKVLIVGGGNLMAHYRNAVATAGLNEAFTFTGYVAYEDLPELYKKMSVFVAPVHSESFGQVTPFAMNMRIPVVGYDVGALPEIIDNPNLLAPAGDSIKLSEIIIDLLDHRDKRVQIGAMNHARAKRLFSVEAMVRRYESIYDEIVNI